MQLLWTFEIGATPVEDIETLETGRVERERDRNHRERDVVSGVWDSFVYLGPGGPVSRNS